MEKICDIYCFKKTRTPLVNSSYSLKDVELVVFDMDGVITDVNSSWNFIHSHFNSDNLNSVNAYLRGKIDDYEFIRRDISLWKENGRLSKKEKIKNILYKISFMKGAKRCIYNLKKLDIKTAIVSAGISILAERAQKKFGIDYVYANGLKSDENDFLTGEGVLNVRLMYKDEAIMKLSKKVNVPLDRIVSVGNSCFDIPMFKLSGFGIAFNPSDQCVVDAADRVIYKKNLEEIASVIEELID
ncbi:MAG: HAD-IB family phosphatase [Candidatus Thermoplasmatota archaeon]